MFVPDIKVRFFTMSLLCRAIQRSPAMPEPILQTLHDNRIAASSGFARDPVQVRKSPPLSPFVMILLDNGPGSAKSHCPGPRFA